MAGRQRSPKKRNLPPNLYENRGYFVWRNPTTGKSHGLGRDRQAAIAEAVEANIYIAGLAGKRRLVDRLAGVETAVSAWADRYASQIAERKLSKETCSEHARRLRYVRARWGDRDIRGIGTRDVADWLLEWEQAGKKRMAQAMRSFLLDFFRAALAAGWIDVNPVAPTKAAIVTVERARLTLDQFRAIYAVIVRDHPDWAARALELALVTSQRREDVLTLGRRDVHDGRLWVVQGKTANRVCIPLDLRLDAMGWTVGEIIKRCQAGKLVAQTFVHHSGHVGRAKPGDPLRPTTISGVFAEARDKADITWSAGKTPPTFHEIRSLSARLYDEQGVNAQALLGHKSADMTSLYRDVRGAEWVEVRTR